MTGITWMIIGVIGSVVGLAFISILETALVSINHVRLHQLAEQGHPTAPIVEDLVSRPQELLGGLIILINAFVLLAANLTTAIALRVWSPGVTVWANIVVLLLLLVVGEITPKTIGVYYAEAIALRTARITRFTSVLLSPLVIVIHGVSIGLLRTLSAMRILPGKVRPVPTAFSDEDLKQLVSAGEQSGEVEASEREMIHGAIEFAQTFAYEIMVPRTDLVALDVDTAMEEAVATFLESGHSRLPVYEENADNIIGILYIKDVLIHLHETATPVMVRALLRTAYFVPETKKSDELLREMQRRRVHLAVVVDEYGGTAGIITIEDLLEEIVGDIIDEYDTERQEIERLPDGASRVSGRASLEKIAETFDIPIDEDETESETISGLVTEILGRIPEVGDRVVIKGVEFTVQDVAHNRIETLRAVVLPSADLPDDATD